MKKIFFIISFTFLFFFLFIPNTYAKTSADYMKDKDKYLIDTYPNFYTNLDSKFVSGLSNAIQLYFGQRTTTEFLNFNQWSRQYSDGGGIFFDGRANSLYADSNNISSFIYGFNFTSSYDYLANQNYEFVFILSTSKEVDYYAMKEFVDDLNFCYTAKNSMRNVCDKVAFDYSKFGFLRETSSDSDAVHYWFVMQFQPNIDLEYLSIEYSKTDLDVENSNYIKFLDNLTNKTISVSLAQSRFFNVDEFSNSSGIIHGGGGITFDGERTDDSSFDDNLEVCDVLDISCHFRNLKNWFKTLGRRISNGFESVVNFFKDIFSFFSDSKVDITDVFKRMSEGITGLDNGLTSIITKPLYFIQDLPNYKCNELTLYIPLIQKSVNLPCMKSLYYMYFGELFSFYQTVTTGLISYWCLVKMLMLLLQFKDPFSDKVEVLDL